MGQTQEVARKDGYLAALKGLTASQAKEVEALSAHSRSVSSQLREERKKTKKMQAELLELKASQLSQVFALEQELFAAKREHLLLFAEGHSTLSSSGPASGAASYGPTSGQGSHGPASGMGSEGPASGTSGEGRGARTADSDAGRSVMEEDLVGLLAAVEARGRAVEERERGVRVREEAVGRRAKAAAETVGGSEEVLREVAGSVVLAQRRWLGKLEKIEQACGMQTARRRPPDHAHPRASGDSRAKAEAGGRERSWDEARKEEGGGG
ncbi:hypothetical protein T484DRAFT_1917479, partial [Baffinella frigidus]